MPKTLHEAEKAIKEIMFFYNTHKGSYRKFFHSSATIMMTWGPLHRWQKKAADLLGKIERVPFKEDEHLIDLFCLLMNLYSPESNALSDWLIEKALFQIFSHDDIEKFKNETAISSKQIRHFEHHYHPTYDYVPGAPEPIQEEKKESEERYFGLKSFFGFAEKNNAPGDPCNDMDSYDLFMAIKNNNTNEELSTAEMILFERRGRKSVFCQALLIDLWLETPLNEVPFFQGLENDSNKKEIFIELLYDRLNDLYHEGGAELSLIVKYLKILRQFHSDYQNGLNKNIRNALGRLFPDLEIHSRWYRDDYYKDKFLPALSLLADDNVLMDLADRVTDPGSASDNAAFKCELVANMSPGQRIAFIEKITDSLENKKNLPWGQYLSEEYIFLLNLPRVNALTEGERLQLINNNFRVFLHSKTNNEWHYEYPFILQSLTKLSEIPEDYLVDVFEFSRGSVKFIEFIDSIESISRRLTDNQKIFSLNRIMSYLKSKDISNNETSGFNHNKSIYYTVMGILAEKLNVIPAEVFRFLKKNCDDLLGHSGDHAAMVTLGYLKIASRILDDKSIDFLVASCGSPLFFNLKAHFTEMGENRDYFVSNAAFNTLLPILSRLDNMQRKSVIQAASVNGNLANYIKIHDPLWEKLRLLDDRRPGNFYYWDWDLDYEPVCNLVKEDTFFSLDRNNLKHNNCSAYTLMVGGLLSLPCDDRVSTLLDLNERAFSSKCDHSFFVLSKTWARLETSIKNDPQLSAVSKNLLLALKPQKNIFNQMEHLEHLNSNEDADNHIKKYLWKSVQEFNEMRYPVAPNKLVMK